MSVAVFDQILTPTPFSAAPLETKRPGRFDIWSSIKSNKQKELAEREQDEPYVHPLVRRSSSLLSQKSLEICTESLGSESGSDDFFSSDDESDLFSANWKRDHQEQNTGRLLNYHCSVSSRRSSAPRRSFPPPLPSISSRDGPCLQMRPHRKDGRLVIEAVPVPAQNYLHAERQGGRLILSFVNAISSKEEPHKEASEEQVVEEAQEINHEMIEAEQEEEEEEEEEEVEVVERRTVVEVKVSTQPQQNTTKVHRSSIVINKFVSGNKENYTIANAPSPTSRRLSSTTTTAAAAAVAASSVGAASVGEGGNKLLFVSKRRNREELLHDMRKCSQLRKPLFIWEPCCIATSS